MPELVNLGSLCIDNVYAVPAIVRAGETVLGRPPVRHAGGKGLNQSLAAARAGLRVVHVGCVGADGEWLKELLAAAGVDVDGIRVIAHAGTGHAVIQVTPNGENAIVIVGGANRQLQSADVGRAIDRARADNWLLLQNEVNDIGDILLAAKHAHVNVAFNVAPVDGTENSYPLDAVSLLLVNEIEAMSLAGEDRASRALDRLTRERPNQHVVVTRGAAGLLYGHGSERLEVGAFAVQAVDETGAGDAFIGYLLAAWLQGAPLQERLRRASAAGALAVCSAGAANAIPASFAVDEFLAAHR
jgi:ribokinase